MQKKIFKTGHSLAITLSKNILDKAGLALGEYAEVEISGDKIVIVKSKTGSQQPLQLKIRKKL